MKLIQSNYFCLNHTRMSNKIIGVKNDPEVVKEDPLGDDVIRKYLPNCRILKYSQFRDFNNIEDILPHDKDYCIILYENQPNSGHWTAIMRFDDRIEYFDFIFSRGSKTLLNLQLKVSESNRI